jgi:hypothetical protein
MSGRAPVFDRIAPTLALLSLTTAAGAQPLTVAPEDAPDEPALPRYNVEVIIFAHNDVNPGEERFELAAPRALGQTVVGRAGAPSPADIVAIERLGTAGSSTEDPRPGTVAPGAPGTRAGAGPGPETAPGATEPANDPLEFVTPFGTPSPGGGAPADVPEHRFRLLSDDELELDRAANVIDRLGAYRLLGHGGWQQDGLAEADAIRFDVANLGIANPTGTVELYLGRFLHFGVDLTYRLPPGLRLESIAESDGAAAGASGGPSLRANPPRVAAGSRLGALGALEIAQRVRLRAESNAIRSGELHYIDHPLFGVLVLITPAPEPDEDGSEAAAQAQPAA